MTLQTQEEKGLALRALEKRKEEAFKIGQIDNESLPVGAPMCYYCKLCGLLVEKLPENHAQPPRKYCSECKEVVDAGWDGKEFIEYVWVICASCGGTGNTSYKDYYTKKPRKCSSCRGEGRKKVRKDR